MAEPIEMRFGLWDQMGPRESCVRWGLDPPWIGAILGERGAHCKAYGLTVMSCAKTAEPVDLPFGFWTWVGPRKDKFNRIRQVTPMCRHGRHIGAIWQIQLNRLCGGDAALCQITFTSYHWLLLGQPSCVICRSVRRTSEPYKNG